MQRLEECRNVKPRREPNVVRVLSAGRLEPGILVLNRLEHFGAPVATWRACPEHLLGLGGGRVDERHDLDQACARIGTSDRMSCWPRTCNMTDERQKKSLDSLPRSPRMGGKEEAGTDVVLSTWSLVLDTYPAIKHPELSRQNGIDVHSSIAHRKHTRKSGNERTESFEYDYRVARLSGDADDRLVAPTRPRLCTGMRTPHRG